MALDRVFYEIYRHEHEGENTIENFSCYNYVFISRRPLAYYLQCYNNNINRKELHV